MCLTLWLVCYIFTDLFLINMDTDKKHYDGSVSIVVDGDIESDFWSKAEEEERILFAPAGSSFLPIPAEHIVRLGSASASGGLIQRRIFEKTRGLSPDALVDMSELIGDRVHKEVYELIGKGRLRLSLILNSLGGLGSVSEEIGLIANRVREQGGSVYSYARYASSAAANMFMAADSGQRYLLPYSSLLFHTAAPGIPDCGEERARNLAETSWVYLEKMILDNVKPEQKDRVAKILKKIKGRYRSEFSLRAVQAERIGIAKIPRHGDNSFKSLEQQFMEDHEISRTVFEGTQISKFFDMAHTKNWDEVYAVDRVFDFLETRVFRTF